VAAIAVGVGDHVCAIRADGSLWCWGDNRLGETGQSPASAQCRGDGCTTAPARVANLPSVRAVGLGTYHSCALTDSDQVFCWGYNGDGELGHDFAADPREKVSGYPYSSTPSLIDLPPVESLAVGELHACAVLKDGSVRCWGQAYLGQLATDQVIGGPDGGLLMSYVPLPVDL